MTAHRAHGPGADAVPDVVECEVDQDMVACAGLDEVHYREGFVLRTDARRSAEEWARLVIEQAPAADRAKMLTAWTLFGIRLRLRSPDHVLGWRVHRNEPDRIVLGVRAAVGVTARLVLRPGPGTLTHAMLIRYDHPLGRLIWTRFAPAHRRFYVTLLRRAGRVA